LIDIFFIVSGALKMALGCCGINRLVGIARIGEEEVGQA